MTTIEDTLTYIDGSKANGRLVVGWKPFTVGNVNAAGGELEWQIVEGAVSISLYANTGAQPTGSYYVVKYELENGAVYLEQWIVPDLPTVNLGQVRVAFPPSPSVMISPLQLTSLGAAPGMFLMWNGQRWVPGYPGTFSFVDPTLVKGDMIVRGDVAPATRLGVGLDGWTLIADSSQPLGIKWIAPVSGFADPTTTKGDLIVRGIAGTTRLGAAATNGWVLTADSTDATFGIKWKAVPLSPQTPWTQDIDGAGFRLINTGNVGIGTTSPGAKLSFGSTISDNLIWLYDSASIPAGFGIRGGQFLQYVGGGGAIVFGSMVSGTFTERMRMEGANGNVGIGTTGPAGKLSIGGDSLPGIPTYRGSLIISEYTSTLNMNMGIEFQTRGDGGGFGWRLSSLANNVDFVFESRSNNVAWTERMRILNNGNVGIGTTSPGVSLDTSGSIRIMGSQAAPSGIGLEIAFDGTQGYIQCLARPSGAWKQITYNASAHLFGQGNVGIGLSPSYKLDVAGDVNTSTVFRVQGLPAARIIAYLDQTGARALNVVYQNTQPAPIFVAVTATINQSQFMQLLTDLGNPPTNVICTQSNASGSLTINQTLNGWVMSGQYYKVNAPSATLIKWFEWQ